MAEKKTVKPEDELVTVQLFKDSGKYKNDVTLHVNGQNVVIQRGVKVKIKRKFLSALNNAQKQQYQAYILMDKMQKKASE